MQAGSSKILHSFYALTNRSLQLEFHTSACTLKGGKRPKTKSFNGKGAPKSARSPARKRLVSSLRPEGKAGTYEVAKREHARPREKELPARGSRTSQTPDRERKSSRVSARDDMPRREEGTPRRDKDSLRKGEGMPHRQEDTVVESQQIPVTRPEEKKFEREDAPHRGRLTDEEIRRARGPRRRGVDFGLRGSAARRPRFKPEEAGRGLWARGGDDYANQPERPRIPKTSTPSPLPDEFHTPEFEPLKTLPNSFSSPPLMEGLLKSVHDILGPDARPSPIQSLALKHLFTPPAHILSAESRERSASLSHRAPSLSPGVWGQHLLAAETGSGKSIAYLLPMLQHLKLTEHNPTPLHSAPTVRPLPLNPRGLILAPTHELVRQLAAFAKALLHHMRLRVLCASRSNTPSSVRERSTARQLKRHLDETGFGMTGVGLHGNRPVDILVGTPTKILEMVRGLGWDRAERIEDEWDEARKERARRWVPGPPEMALANVEWVVVDEADVLFDRDFEKSTRLLLADIARARGYTHPSFAALDAPSGTLVPPPSTSLAYPFHLTLTSATIPSSLANYLSIAHPKLTRLASPRLHRLPSTLTTEHCDWTSGNKNSDIEKRIMRVWADDMQTPSKARSKVLVFCNKSSKVNDLGLYLKEKGIPNVALTSESSARGWGSNRHLNGFLKNTENVRNTDSSSQEAHASSASHPSAPTNSATPGPTFRESVSSSDPHVLITTSLLSRGLDFSPQIQHVFVADPPRNMVDFLHRAGRAGRAGNAGRVVLFGKSKGRGSGESRQVRRRVGTVAN